MTTTDFRDNRADLHEPYRAAPDRFSAFDYRHLGDTGLVVSPIGLGFWYNFGDDKPFQNQRDIVRFAFDHGINHFDLADQYGPPLGAAEENFGRIVRKDLARYRNELVVTTKAGWPQWLGPNGRLGGRKHLLNGVDESLQRLGLDYVDIYYSHRFDSDTPLEETIAALDSIVRQGKALFVGVSSYSAERTREALEIAERLGTPLVVNQSSYSLLNRWIEDDLLTVLAEHGGGAVAFTPLAQGLLTGKYLGGYENVERANVRGDLPADALNDENLRRLRGLNEIALERGQTLSQLAISWVLRQDRVASALIGVSRVEQLEENLQALDRLDFSDDEFARIDEFAVRDGGVNPWKISSEL